MIVLLCVLVVWCHCFPVCVLVVWCDCFTACFGGAVLLFYCVFWWCGVIVSSLFIKIELSCGLDVFV